MKRKEGEEMRVLSLFDGISCGMIALEKAGIHVDVCEGAKYKAIGNGWTIDVITHIFKNLKEGDAN